MLYLIKQNVSFRASSTLKELIKNVRIWVEEKITHKDLIGKIANNSGANEKLISSLCRKLEKEEKIRIKKKFDRE